MAHHFTIEPEALKRRFSVYVVVVQTDDQNLLYIGKTGDNREGCNPIISRCGNHFSYNRIHSQVRNKVPAHEEWNYTYIFEHFDEYPDDIDRRRLCVERINEMERWLNELVQEEVRERSDAKVMNPFKGKSRVSRAERARRQSFRSREAESKILEIVDHVSRILGAHR